jgi:hypothetical protein
MLAAILAGVENVGSIERHGGFEFSNEIVFRHCRAGRLNFPAQTCKGDRQRTKKICQNFVAQAACFSICAC